ncbi:MAG: hypothetical protein JST92_11495 [Deltaproteobacteria bacterium]|nr:hypothetical protein [Deltaproteobacteria bacterium]
MNSRTLTIASLLSLGALAFAPRASAGSEPAPSASAGEAAPAPAADPAKKDGAVRSDSDAPIASEKGLQLDKVLKAIKADAQITLNEAAQADVLNLMPLRRGDDCAEAAKVTPVAFGLRDRGDGPTLVVRMQSCKGATLLAFSTGILLKVARLLDLDDDSVALQAVHLLNLRGGKHEEDLAVQLSVAPHGSELRVFLRRGDGFAFTEAGRIKDVAMEGECQQGSDDPSGWASFVKTDAKSRLMIVRVDLVCGGQPSAASCTLWGAQKGDLSTVGVCPLPPKLDAKSLRASGWR